MKIDWKANNIFKLKSAQSQEDACGYIYVKQFVHIYSDSKLSDPKDILLIKELIANNK